MELSAGTRLGPYEIVRSIGAGGMGVVYRAKDTRLDRSVAVKVLPSSLRGDADRMRRFEQEARTVGGLNHPNLVTLHDVGRHDDVPYLVTELLEGQSLRVKLGDGAISQREAVKIAIEIARGLAAAHGANIVHRDIKPDNVYVTSDGRVKILDFGIAKLQRDTPEDLANAATLGGGGTAATGTGVVIGTPGYMAPEQLASGEVDARTDVFALGVVLFEMLARKRPFAADTGIEESYAVVKQPPNPLPDSVPPALARVVLRCLEKRREARFQSAADLAFALESFETAPTGPTGPMKPVEAPAPAPTTEVTPRPRRKLPIIPLALIGAVTVLGLAWLFRSHPKAPTPLTAVERPHDQWPERVPGGPKYIRLTFKSEPKWFARFASNDTVLFSLRDGEDYKVMRTDLTQRNIVEVQGAKGRVLDISKGGEIALRQRMPDKPGGLLALFKEGMGAPRERDVNIHDASYVGEELAVIRDAGNGMTIEYPIGTTILKGPSLKYEFLRASPDGTKLAVVVHEIATDTRGYVIVFDPHGKQLAQSQPRPTIDGLAWSVKGDEVWFSDDNGIEALDDKGQIRTIVRAPTDVFLRDVRHDETSKRILVAPKNLHVHAFARRGGADIDIGWRSALVCAISRDGTTIGLLEGTGIGETADGYQMYVRKGKEQPVPIEHGFEIGLTPDGSLAVALVAGNKLRVLPTRAGAPRDLPVGPIERFDYSSKLEITADAKNVIVLAAAKGQPLRFWQIALDGNSAPVAVGPEHVELIGEDERQRFSFAASPDGKWIAVPGDNGFKLLPVSGGEEQLIPGKHSENPIGFSDDGRAVFVWRTHGWPRPIERVELAEPHKRSEIFSFDVPEKPETVEVAVDGSAATVAYAWAEISSDLFVLEPP
jgi:serine/threonine protein kinase